MASKSTNHTTESPAKKRPRLSRKSRHLLELMRQWRDEGDKEEQRETGEYLMKALDEGRKGYRTLFS